MLKLKRLNIKPWKSERKKKKNNICRDGPENEAHFSPSWATARSVQRWRGGHLHEHADAYGRC